MPAGTYYVGDLCYVMHEEWDEVCGLFFAGRNDHGCNQGEFNLRDGRRFASFNTKWGDGGYYDKQGREYSVDAGLIGCIKVSDIKEHTISEDFRGAAHGGQIIHFPHDFEVSGGDNRRDWNGVIRIGNVSINTDGEDDESDDDY